MSFAPMVLHPLTLPKLLDHVLTTPSDAASTTLIICSSREAFIQDLLQSLQHEQSEDQHQQQHQHQHQHGTLQDLVTPSLHNLCMTRHIKLAFCASVQTLLAYLTAYVPRSPQHAIAGQGSAKLVLVNPLALHAPTPSFSAQGLSRTFAAATETALRTGVVLQVVECGVKRRRMQIEDDEDINMTNDEAEHGHGNEDRDGADPWEQEISILNVSARRFGSNSSNRAWAGRTVKAKSIAAKWFRFQQLNVHENGART